MSFNAKDMTQGGQIASMRIRMFSQIANIMLYCLFIFFWILVGLVLWVKISWQTFVNGCIYWWCTTLEGMRDLIKSQPVYEIQYYGKTFRMNAAQVLHDKYMIWCGEQLWSAFVLASVVALVTGPRKPHSASGPDVDVSGRAWSLSVVCSGVGAESVPPCAYQAVGH